MQTDNKIFDDLARLATGAAGALHGVKGEVEESVRAWLERQLSSMDLVTRDEFEAVKTMAEKARIENDALRTELELLREKFDKT